MMWPHLKPVKSLGLGLETDAATGRAQGHMHERWQTRTHTHRNAWVSLRNTHLETKGVSISGTHTHLSPPAPPQILMTPVNTFGVE